MSYCETCGENAVRGHRWELHECEEIRRTFMDGAMTAICAHLNQCTSCSDVLREALDTKNPELLRQWRVGGS